MGKIGGARLSHRAFLKWCGLAVVGAGASQFVTPPKAALAYTYNENLIVNAPYKLGIGTGSPVAALHIDTNDPPIRFRRAGGTGTGELTIDNRMMGSGSDLVYTPIPDSPSGTAGHALYVVNGGVTAFGMGITGSGNVGIGTTSPAHRLDVAGDTRIGKTDARQYLKISSLEWPELRYQTPTHNEVIRVGVAHAADAGYSVGAGDWYVYSADTNRMDLIVARMGGVYLAAGGGNVGIGTSNPQGKLDVAGDVRVNGAVAIDTSGVAKQSYYAQ